MKNQNISINTNTYLRLLFLVPAICLLGFTGCSSTDAGTGFHTGLISKLDPHPNEDVVAANRNPDIEGADEQWKTHDRAVWQGENQQWVNHFGWHGNPPLSPP